MPKKQPEFPTRKDSTLEALRERLTTRNLSIDGAIVQLDQQINQYVTEANRLNAIKQELAAEKTANVEAMK